MMKTQWAIVQKESMQMLRSQRGLVWLMIFSGLLSARTGSVPASLMSTLTLLMLAAAPLVIGPGLRGTVIGRAMDALNPFAGALNTFDSVIIDSEPFTAQSGRWVLVVVWLVVCLLVARRSAAHPEFK
jgi:hypothetical protein